MNSIGWIVGHLAWQEQRYWLTRAQGETPIPVLNELVANGGPRRRRRSPRCSAAGGR